MSHLEGAVQVHIQGLLDEVAGPDHTAHVDTVTEDGLIVLVKKLGAKSWKKESLFTLTWREALEIFVRPGPMTVELTRRVEERKSE